MKLTYGNVSIEVHPDADPREHKEAYEAFGRLCGFLPPKGAWIPAPVAQGLIDQAPEEEPSPRVPGKVKTYICQGTPLGWGKLESIKWLRNEFNGDTRHPLSTLRQASEFVEGHLTPLSDEDERVLIEVGFDIRPAL